MKKTSILILSEQSDNSADEVCLWLNYFGAKYLRLNKEDSKNCRLKIDTRDNTLFPTIVVDGMEYSLADFKTVWFRRGHFLHYDTKLEIDCFANQQNNNHMEKILFDYKYSEFDRIRQFFYQYLRDNADCYNFPSTYNINKLLALNYAKSVGLNIPNTLVTNSKSELLNFAENRNGKIITKSISEFFNKTVKDYAISVGTSNVSDFDSISDTFFYSLFQENIEKRLEVRTFIWDNKTYSAAIFHNNDAEAKVDFRTNYDAIRITPFNLPKEIENKLLQLMKKLNLESGSADFILTAQNEYYFLEVNPVGQFDFVDKICNYNLAQIIAKTLTNENH
ncbi:MAG: grasp-with-spasm system ATP-grasp peptide maturase [Bacteroidales bacterium]|jgi:ATP-GRASP peptide maturase of grasp-with-spasm system|nr:grasp-with-spasm system ATP-grasp peptide maturase [Bacteroidales bacterium]